MNTENIVGSLLNVISAISEEGYMCGGDYHTAQAWVKTILAVVNGEQYTDALAMKHYREVIGAQNDGF